MKCGDLVTTNFQHGSEEIWCADRGFVRCAVVRGDLLVVLEGEQKRVKVVTPRGEVGWIAVLYVKEI